MALIDQVRNICNRLAPCGWRELLLPHGLDILAADLEHELDKILSIDRSAVGFEDFALSGMRGIEPGKPAQSLLYHALASPNVITAENGAALQAYPTAAELETLVNYVYGRLPPSMQQLEERANGAPMAVVVFAMEYRPAPDTVHKSHADLCFSRTGVSRVGTAAPLYDAQSRGFLPFVEDDDFAIRVLPARYSAYIAVQRKGHSSCFGPMRFGEEDAGHDFWVPLHKLFSGSECIDGMTLDVQLHAQHKNEKLRRIHLSLAGNSGWTEPDISKPPFVITEGLGDWLPEHEFGPGLMTAIPRESLVEAAEYQGAPLTFNVPEEPDLMESSLQLPGNAPEYVHIRHNVDDTGHIINLNHSTDMLDELEQGGFNALHYLDFTADGWIQAQCPALDIVIPRRVAAYSLLCAPDFYPLCNQRHLNEWLESIDPERRNKALLRAPQCLSDARHPANIQSFPTRFTSTDVSITAIVGQLGASAVATNIQPNVASARRASCLPDAASGDFAPGWDIGVVDYETESGDVRHMAAYRLGSPFPEDAKLCAALSSFWPAVAPDSAQSYEPDAAGPTIKPMLDMEIGIAGGFSWDGIVAPTTYVADGQTYKAYQTYLYGDYTENALEGKFSLALTGKVDSQEYQRRIDALLRVNQSLGEQFVDWYIGSFTVATSSDWADVITNENVEVTLSEPAYRFELFRYKPAPSPTFNRSHVNVVETCIYLVGRGVMLRKPGTQPRQCV